VELPPALAEAIEATLPHLRGVPWARIAEFVGHSDLTVTANTYTHVPALLARQA
jgi:integrase